MRHHGRGGGVPRGSAILLAAALGAALLATACDRAHSDSIALTNRGVEAYNAGEPDIAADYFVRAIQRDEQNDVAFYHLGLIELYDRRDPAEAQIKFAEAYRLNPGNPDAAFQLGALHLEAGKPDMAQGLLERALKGDPQNHQAHYYLGRVFEAKQKYAEADGEYRRAITLYPQYPAAFDALARVYTQFDHIDVAIDVLREGVRLNPESAELQSSLGLALIDVGDLKGAITALHEALAYDPEDMIHFFNLGMAYERAGDAERAIQLLQRFVELSGEGQGDQVTLAKAVMNTLMTEKDARLRVRHLELPTPPPPPADGGPTGGPDATP